MITACLALILSTSVIFGEFRGKESIIRRKLLNGYSDSQIMQGIGIQSELIRPSRRKGETDGQRYRTGKDELDGALSLFSDMDALSPFHGHP